MIAGNYILGADGKPKLEKNVLVWATWFEKANRIVKQTRLGSKYLISTVFLGLDYRFSGKGKPLLWETMVFKAMTKAEADKENKAMEDILKSIKKRGMTRDKAFTTALRFPKYKRGYMQESDEFPMERYTTREEAEKRHTQIVALVKKTKYRKVK